jgi:hypothetical protein
MAGIIQEAWMKFSSYFNLIQINWVYIIVNDT